MKQGVALLKKVLSWIFGVLFLVLSTLFISSSLISFFISLLLGLVLIPPVIPYLSNRLHFILKPWQKFLGVLALFILLLVAFPSVPETGNDQYQNNKSATNESSESEALVLDRNVERSDATKPASYSVVYVVDGDTLDVLLDGVKSRVRLIGVDTPEIVDPRKPVQCFAKEASDKAKSILTGKSVTLEADPSQGDKDKYDRLLRYVFLEDGTNFNKTLISEGYAHEYTYNLPYKYQAEFKAAEKYAIDNKMGLWADNACSDFETSNTPALDPTTTPTPVVPTTTTTQKTNTPTSYVCSCSKSCAQMSSCEEAYYQLNQCGCSKRDGDKDGVPCEDICN